MTYLLRQYQTSIIEAALTLRAWPNAGIQNSNWKTHAGSIARLLSERSNNRCGDPGLTGECGVETVSAEKFRVHVFAK